MIQAFFIYGIYSLLILAFIIGNRRLKAHSLKDNPRIKVSVIVAFKDEEKNIEILAKSLIQQEYPTDLLEFVFVNDHSNDRGKEVLRQALKESSFHYKILDLEDSKGKKSALDFGINSSEGELILTTDADCWMGPLWVKSMANQFKATQSSFVAGPVGLESDKSFVGNIMQLEFAALIASTSGGFGINKAFMCNGANLGFSRKLYDELKPYDANKNLASGDDVFFLHQVKDKKRNHSFNKNSAALVYSSVETDLMKFWKQRMRWASKSVDYQDEDIMGFGFLILIVNIVMILSVLSLVLSTKNLNLFLILFVWKYVLDTALIISAKRWIKAKNIILNSLLLSFIYPFYSVGIALLSLGFKPKWKGRRIR